MNVSQRRFPGLSLLLYPVRVQGEVAAKEIAEAIRFLNTLSDIDVLIMGRGGGSLEDLWPFNEEIVAREIFNSRVPVISAVGHETDWTIADFVSDRRAPTPSAAAEMVAPHREDLLRRIIDLKTRVSLGVLNCTQGKQKELDRFKASYAFKQPQNIIEQYTQVLDSKIRELTNYKSNLLNKKSSAFKEIVSKLEVLSPLGVLKRGYSLSVNKKGEIVRSVSEIKAGDKIKTRVVDGEIVSIVEGVRLND